jgi:pimeloyl-ACP methyl ester carboxylesterase
MTVTVQHHRIVTEGGVTLRYVTAGEGPTLVLLHGFPQSWTAWQPVIQRVGTRFRVVAPLLRGLGGTPGPVDGYDTHSLAADVRAIVATEGDDQPVAMCGHDIGSHVAFAYALIYRPLVRALVMVGPPPPGTEAMDDLATNPRTWHLAFHLNVDVAHMLISGRERQYIDYFIRSRLFDNAAISSDDIDEYADLYAAPGALRSALEMYRALPIDRELNLAELTNHGKLDVPVAAVGSGLTSSRASLDSVLDEVATDGKATLVERSGHWIPQEQPDVLATIINDLARSQRSD